MSRLERWIICLLLWHFLVVVVSIRCWGNITSPPYWMGSLIVFSLPTVQFTWSFTVALMVGPDRRRRKLYWNVLLLSFLPLSLVYGFCMMAYLFLGSGAVVLCLLVCMAVLIAETVAGILYGNALRSQLQDA